MKHILIQIMSELTVLSAEEIIAIEESFPIKTFPKATNLLREGQIAKEGYFVVKGCIRRYELINGEEKTIDFYTENQSAINFDSLVNKTPSKHYFVCLEETTVAVADHLKEQALYKKYPRFETFCRTGMEQMFANQHQTFSKFITMKPKERYLNLLKERPYLINRVPQYQLASYLGIQPETLSRIRKKIIAKS
ncbi:MAG: Crp/Fnr family transcriptional regulator [Chitinophagales bacterium]